MSSPLDFLPNRLRANSSVLFSATAVGLSAIVVAYGVGVIFVAGVVNAVKNVPQIYIDNARMLGASRWRVYTTVILPSTSKADV